MKDVTLACDELVNRMIESNAPNYNQHILIGDDGNEYVVTVQKKGGLTPCEKLGDNINLMKKVKAKAKFYYQCGSDKQTLKFGLKEIFDIAKTVK